MQRALRAPRPVSPHLAAVEALKRESVRVHRHFRPMVQGLMHRALSAPRPVESSSHRAAVEGLEGVADGISSMSDDEIPGVIAGAARLQARLSLTLTAQSHTAVLSSR